MDITFGTQTLLSKNFLLKFEYHCLFRKIMLHRFSLHKTFLADLILRQMKPNLCNFTLSFIQHVTRNANSVSLPCIPTYVGCLSLPMSLNRNACLYLPISLNECMQLYSSIYLSIHPSIYLGISCHGLFSANLPLNGIQST